MASLQTSPSKVSNRTIRSFHDLLSESDVKKHLAHSLKKTHYLTPANLNTPVETVDQESVVGTEGTAKVLDDGQPNLAAKVK